MGFSSQNRECGFTLIELLIAMSIGTLVMATVTNVFISQKRAYHAQEQVNEMQQNVRAALDLMTRDIKMAGYDPTGGAFTDGIPSLAALRILADSNGDGDIDDNPADANEDITYSFDFANLRIQRNDVNSSGIQVLASLYFYILRE